VFEDVQHDNCVGGARLDLEALDGTAPQVDAEPLAAADKKTPTLAPISSSRRPGIR
jgi:hypothetical protein